MTVVAAKFVGARKPLDEIDIPRLAHRIAVSEDHLRAFVQVEAAGRPYDRQGRPTMLFEPHVFYRHLRGEKRERAVTAGLAYEKWGTQKYPAESYTRLFEAVKIDEDAALRSCSIGLSQVLVENHSMVGFATPQAMWQAFMDDEEEHIEAMVRYILATGIDDDIREERWETVARVYNGPGFKRNGYDTKLAAAFRQWAGRPDSAWAPDKADPVALSITDSATLATVQRKLIELGYPEVGKPDGKFGSKTRAAVLGFRADKGLPLVADVDQQLLSALMLSTPREVSPERAATTAGDLERAGSRKVAAASRTEAVGALVGVGAAVTAAEEALTQVDTQIGQLRGVLDAIGPLIDALKEVSPVLLLALGGYVFYQQLIVKRATVQDYREGKYVGR